MDSREKLQLASMIAGILSLCFLIFGLGLPAGALGLVFALLSRGDGPLEGRAKTGFILSLVGLIIGAVMVISSVYLVTSGAYDKMLNQFYQLTEEEGVDGEDPTVKQVQEMLEQMLGEQQGSDGGNAYEKP